MIFKSCLGQLNRKDIYREIYSQMEMFKDTTGHLPDYVDGHEFCHHFPVVREALIDIVEEFHFKKNNIYIRVFHPGKVPFLRNGIFWLFNHLASLKDKGINYNSHLLSFHPYK